MKFGTDGFRGPADTVITPEFCLSLGFHTGSIIKEKGYDSVIIGKDTRVSGYMLEAALQAGFISAGIDVKLAGPIPTPAVSFLTATYAGQFGVVISASHNPFADNGIKFFNRHGRKISRELEKEIENRLQNSSQPLKAKDLGKAFRIDSASGRYVEYCKSTLKGNSTFQNKTILVDGDGDRLVLSDSDGIIFDGDDILYTLAARNKIIGKEASDKVIGTTMSNQGLVEALDSIGVGFIRTDVGDKFISRELVKENLNVGAEPSGHIIQREYSESGDANIALIQTISALEELDTTMQEIKSKINYKPLTLKNFPVKNIDIIETKSFNETIDDLKDHFPSARISVRKSGTEPIIRVMAEADTEDDKDEILNRIESLIA